MTSERVLARRTELYDLLAAHPHQWWTIADAAYALGRSPGQAFGLDLSAVRHLAREMGACVTNCTYRHDIQAQAFTFLPSKDENMQSVGPLRTQSRRARTALRNLGEQSDYAAEDAVLGEDRAYGRLNRSIASSVSNILEAVEDFEKDLEKDETPVRSRA